MYELLAQIADHTQVAGSNKRYTDTYQVPRPEAPKHERKRHVASPSEVAAFFTRHHGSVRVR